MSGKPPVLLLAAFGAGLATGLAHFQASLGIALVLSIAALAGLAGLLLAGPGLATLYTAGVLVGALHGTIARLRDGTEIGRAHV